MVKINVTLVSYIFFLFIFSKSINAQSKNIPDNLPLHTKILWGENGILRKINFIPKNRNAELRLRVQMLQLHQKLSLGTMFLFGYQSYLGNQMVNGDYSKHDLHSSLSRYVWSSYMVSAGLSYLAPPALKYSKRKDSMTFHRYLSWLHFSGMAIIPYLGYNIDKSSDYDSAVKIHQKVAVGTLSCMLISALLSFLPY